MLVHSHTNGDQATEMALDCLEGALLDQPARDHRFTLQHCQLADAAQFRRMAALGMCVNLFPNHHFYWGDQHYETTVGPERAMRMNACATALASGVPLAIHSDAPVTPLGPLFTAWCAVNRRTASGRTLGTSEASRSPTRCARSRWAPPTRSGSTARSARSNAASAPTSRCWRTIRWRSARSKLKDVRIWGTVQGGRPFPANGV